MQTTIARDSSTLEFEEERPSAFSNVPVELDLGKATASDEIQQDERVMTHVPTVKSDRDLMKLIDPDDDDALDDAISSLTRRVRWNDARVVDELFALAQAQSWSASTVDERAIAIEILAAARVVDLQQRLLRLLESTVLQCTSEEMRIAAVAAGSDLFQPHRRLFVETVRSINDSLSGELRPAASAFIRENERT